MRACLTLIFSVIVFAAIPGPASGQATRFVGTSTSPITLRLHETNGNSRTVPVSFSAIWDIDVTTDGQSITFNTWRLSFSGTVSPQDNPFVSLDLVFESQQTGTFDINPIGGKYWDVSRYGMNTTLSGTYHSFQYSQPFAVALTLLSGETWQTRLNFNPWPGGLVVHKPNESSSVQNDDLLELNVSPTTLLEPFFELDSATITHFTSLALTTAPALLAGCPCCDCGDFDLSGQVDGDDFLLWQRGLGTSSALHIHGDGNGSQTVDGSDLDIWRSHFGESVPGLAAVVPESGALTLATIAAIGLAGSLRKLPQ